MPSAVLVQPGVSSVVANSPWRIVYVEDEAGKFGFRLASRDLKFDPRDKYRYNTHEEAKRAAYCFVELMNRIERSPKRLNILMEIGILKFPQTHYRDWEVWLLLDRHRYSWEIMNDRYQCFRSQSWYKHPENAIQRAKENIDLAYTKAQLQKAIGWS